MEGSKRIIKSKVRFYIINFSAYIELIEVLGVLEHFKENPSCKHIVLGGCHDNGYVRNLNIIVPDESIRDRITLLKSFQTGA
jgi:hypothetical protein